MEKKGRMSRVYTAPGKKASDAQIKQRATQHERMRKHTETPMKMKTPKMGG